MKPIYTILLSFSCLLLFNSKPLQGQCDMDTIEPQLLVVSFSTAVLSSDTKDVKIYARDFAIFFDDNCTPTDSLRFTFTNVYPEDDPNYINKHKSSYKIYDCNSVAEGAFTIDIFLWDSANNYNTGSVQLNIHPGPEVDCDACIDDSTPPEVEMVPSLTWAYPADSNSIEVWASDFVLSASDACTSTSLIQFSFTPVNPNIDPSSAVKYFDCYDVENSPFEVDIYIWDIAGNYTLDSSILNLQVPLGEDCTGNFQNVGGIVLNLNGDPINGVNIYLERESGEILDSTTTNDQGDYSFFTFPDEKFLNISLNNEIKPLISTVDMVIIQRYLLGLDSFSPAQVLAADINQDGRLRINDLKMIRKLIMGITDKEEILNLGWKFMPSENSSTNGGTFENNRIPLSGPDGPTIIGYRIGEMN